MPVGGIKKNISYERAILKKSFYVMKTKVILMK
jgi:glyoxylate utilization-related uncharacterized protein